MLTSQPSLSPSDQEHVVRLPPRCCRQRRLQEHLLRHHTRRGEGGVKRPLGDKKIKQSLCYSAFPDLFFPPLPPHSLRPCAQRFMLKPKTCHTDTWQGWCPWGVYVCLWGIGVIFNKLSWNIISIHKPFLSNLFSLVTFFCLLTSTSVRPVTFTFSIWGEDTNIMRTSFQI